MAITKAPCKGQIVNRTGLSDVFGVALNTVDSWVRQGCPYVQRGAGRGQQWQFNTADVQKWREEKRVEEATGETIADEAELKRRKLAAETAKAELDLAKAKSLVAPLDQVERKLARVFAEIRANLRNIPGRTVSSLIGETNERRFKSVLSEEIDMALASMAAMDLTAEEHDDGEADPSDDE